MITLQAVQDHLGVWVPQVQGKYINEDWEPVTQGYGAQCWDLAAHWSKSLGLPVINTGGAGRWPGWAGNMVDAFPQTPAIAAAYEVIGPDQPGLPGDIPVWGDSNPAWYPKTHVAVLIRDTRNGWLTCMSQNSVPSRGDNPYPTWSTGPTTLQTLPKAGLIGFIRPRTGSIVLSGDITNTTQEAAVALEESDRQLFKTFMDDYFLNVRRFDGNRNIFENALRTRQEIAGVAAGVTDLPEEILFDTKVDGRNIFDNLKQVRTDLFGTRGNVDVQALAKELAAQLDTKDIAELAAQLQITVKEG